MIFQVFVSRLSVVNLWERAYNRGVLSELYRKHVSVWRVLKCVKLNQWIQRYTKPWMVRLLTDAMELLDSLITQAWNRLHTHLFHQLAHGAMVKKNRFIPQPDSMERYTHGEIVTIDGEQYLIDGSVVGFLAKDYLISAGLPRRAYEFYRFLKNGALPGSLLGQINIHLYVSC